MCWDGRGREEWVGKGEDGAKPLGGKTRGWVRVEGEGDVGGVRGWVGK